MIDSALRRLDSLESLCKVGICQHPSTGTAYAQNRQFLLDAKAAIAQNNTLTREQTVQLEQLIEAIMGSPVARDNRPALPRGQRVDHYERRFD